MFERHTQVAVVGAGAAGLYVALTAAREGARVSMISATPLAGSSSYWAQGGLAAALSQDDGPELHFEDTIAAGRDVMRESAARVLCARRHSRRRGPRRARPPFRRRPQRQARARARGRPPARRIVHAGGAATGRRLISSCRRWSPQHERIEVVEGRRATAILTTDGRATGVRLDGGEQLNAARVVLATGGAAALWSRTTNPAGRDRRTAARL